MRMRGTARPACACEEATCGLWQRHACTRTKGKDLGRPVWRRAHAHASWMRIYVVNRRLRRGRGHAPWTCVVDAHMRRGRGHASWTCACGTTHVNTRAALFFDDATKRVQRLRITSTSASARSHTPASRFPRSPRSRTRRARKDRVSSGAAVAGDGGTDAHRRRPPPPGHVRRPRPAKHAALRRARREPKADDCGASAVLGAGRRTCRPGSRRRRRHAFVSHRTLVPAAAPPIA